DMPGSAALEGCGYGAQEGGLSGTEKAGMVLHPHRKPALREDGRDGPDSRQSFDQGAVNAGVDLLTVLPVVVGHGQARCAPVRGDLTDLEADQVVKGRKASDDLSPHAYRLGWSGACAEGDSPATCGWFCVAHRQSAGSLGN